MFPSIFKRKFFNEVRWTTKFDVCYFYKFMHTSGCKWVFLHLSRQLQDMLSRSKDFTKTRNFLIFSKKALLRHSQTTASPVSSKREKCYKKKGACTQFSKVTRWLERRWLHANFRSKQDDCKGVFPPIFKRNFSMKLGELQKFDVC